MSLTSAHFTHCLAATLPVTSSAAPEGRSSGSPDWLSLQLLGPVTGLLGVTGVTEVVTAS